MGFPMFSRRQKDPNVLSWHHNTLGVLVNGDASLAQPVFGCYWQKTAPSEALHSQKWCLCYFPCISESSSDHGVAVDLFRQYERCWRLNLNKDGHWTELSVWLPFRIAVNAFLLILLLKEPLPCKKSMWGEYNAASWLTTKGHCIRKPYLCWVTFGCVGSSVESLWAPSQIQSGEQNGFLKCDWRCAHQRTPKQMAPHCFLYLHFWMSAWVGAMPTSAFSWDRNILPDLMEKSKCFSWMSFCSYEGVLTHG